MDIVLPVLILFGFVGALLLVLASITVVRISVRRRAHRIGAFGLPGFYSLFILVSYLILWENPIARWQGLLIAGLCAMALSSGLLLTYYVSPTAPPSVLRKVPGISTFAVLLAAAAALVLTDIQTGYRGWGWLTGLIVVITGFKLARKAPIYRWHFRDRLEEIEYSEPELLASLEHGPVSRHVLSVIRRWTGTERASP